MKILLTALLILSQLAAFAQPGRARPQLPIDPQTGAPIGAAASQGEPAEELPRFDLEFPGGPVDGFVMTLQHALKRVDEDSFINIIVPPEFERTELPRLKLRNVDILQLFKALELASQRNVTYETRTFTRDGNQIPVQQTSFIRFGFTTTGPITRNSIWYFFAQEPPRTTSIKMVRYFQLGPYLTQFTMDDIGSAIEAGLNMLTEKHSTKLNFHQDTKLLIASGPAEQLEMINTMLKELGGGLTNLTARATMGNSYPAPVVR